MQQVLHVVREARARLVNGLQVGMLRERPLAPLALVELADDLRQQAHVEVQRGRERHVGVEHHLEGEVAEARHVRALLAEAAGAVGRGPVAAADPRQPRDLHQGLLEEEARVVLALREPGDAAHPELERHADRHEVGREIGPQPPEAAHRVPQHREQEEREPEAGERGQHRLDVVAFGEAHRHDRAERQHHAQLEDQHGVEEIEHQPRVVLARVRQHHQEREEDRQDVAREAAHGIGKVLAAQDQLGHRPEEQDRDEIGERDQVEAVALLAARGEHAPAQHAQEQHHPGHEHPAGEDPQRGSGDREQDHDGAHVHLAFGGEERLPQEEHAEVHQ